MKMFKSLALITMLSLPFGATAYADEQKKMGSTEIIEVQATPARCFDRVQFKKIQEESGQTFNSGGIMKPNPATQLLMRLWNSPNGHWTITISRKDGNTCIVAFGNDFHQ